jgi:DNA-binding transcriptional LysR family regulator
MPRGLDVDVLRTFHAVARLGRFKDAAAYVARSPSAVTAQIQKLEDLVGQQLLSRNNQSVQLTQYGRKLLAETAEFLMVHDRLVASLSPQLMAGRIRLGVPDGYAARFMADVLPVCVAGNPMLEVEVEARSSGELLNMFSRHLLDLTIVVSRDELLQGELLFTTQPQWAASCHFSSDPTLPLPLAVQLHGCPYRDVALNTLKTHGIEYRLLLESASASAVEACISNGLAVGIMENPSYLAGHVTKFRGKILPDLPNYFVYLLSCNKDNITLKLHDILKNSFRL